MKKALLLSLFSIFSVIIYAQEKTYVIEIDSLALNYAHLTWHRSDGKTELDSTQSYTPYYVEYGVKGFERGKGGTSSPSGSWCSFDNLTPDTEYAFFVR